MAKKSKKRKKLSRRARQEAGLNAAPVQAKTERPVAPAPHKPEERHPAALGGQPAPAQPAPVSATFTDTSRTRGPEGIDTRLAATEYPAIRQDLRKVGITILVLIATLAGLAVLAANSSIISDLGRELFKLWQ